MARVSSIGTFPCSVSGGLRPGESVGVYFYGGDIYMGSTVAMTAYPRKTDVTTLEMSQFRLYNGPSVGLPPLLHAQATVTNVGDITINDFNVVVNTINQ